MTWELWINVPAMWMNEREHWARKAEKTKAHRTAVHMLARSAKIPALEHCVVELTLYPKIRRRRDADGLVATLKPQADGLVDAGIVVDDTPAFMTKLMPIIADHSDPRGLMCLRVSE